SQTHSIVLPHRSLFSVGCFSMEPRCRLPCQPQVMVGWQIVFDTDKPKSFVTIQWCILFVRRFENGRTFVDLVKHGQVQRPSSCLLRCRHLLPKEIAFKSWNLMVYFGIVVHV